MNNFALNYALIFLITVIEIGINLQTVIAHSPGENFHHLHDGRDGSSDFSNQWIVHLDGSSEAADLLAMKLGYKNLGEVNGFPNFYLMEKLDHPISATEAMGLYTRDLMGEVQVKYAQQLFTKIREKRYPTYNGNPFSKNTIEFNRDILERAMDENILPKGISPELLSLWDEVEKERKDKKRETGKKSNRSPAKFNDNLWSKQWYMHGPTTRSDSGSKTDLHVMSVYDSGITGKGINVCVLDDGFEWKHPDIRENYKKDISWDYNGNDDDPTPSSSSNAHGTRCAGEIAMKANNELCGVGIAYNANIGGIRMLDGSVTDLLEGKAMAHAVDKVDVYSASWGPSDNGKTVEGPGKMASMALEKGIKKGRNGKGVVYVWAAGNGGSKGDNCNCDGYTSSIYTLSIGSATQQGKFPWYGEKCASTMATTYSSGSFVDQKIATIDVNDGCTVSHTGTSASAPLAAGIVALALEANPDLGWRDIQHMVARTSEKSSVSKNHGWQVNGAGLEFNSRFGFGVMNAHRLVNMAKKYNKKVGEQLIKEIKQTSESTRSTRNKATPLVGGKPVTLSFDVSAKDNNLNHLEHVEVLSTIHYPRRGCLEIDLVSPSGTKSNVLTGRFKDNDEKNGFNAWRFMSVHFWGENPKGTWNLHVKNNNEDSQCQVSRDVTFGDMKLILYGTEEEPIAVGLEPRAVPIKDRSLDYFKNDSQDDKEERLRENRQKIGTQVNSHTDWSDLVGKLLSVRQEQNSN